MESVLTEKNNARKFLADKFKDDHSVLINICRLDTEFINFIEAELSHTEIYGIALVNKAILDRLSLKIHSDSLIKFALKEPISYKYIDLVMEDYLKIHMDSVESMRIIKGITEKPIINKIKDILNKTPEVKLYEHIKNR